MDDLGEHHPGPDGGNPDVAQQGPLEGPADDPPLEGADDRTRHGQEHLRRPVAALDELEVRDVLDPQAELGGVPTRRKRRALASPDDGPKLVHPVHLGQHLPQPSVHLVAHGVVLAGAIVGDHGDRSVHLQPDQISVLGAECAHGRSPLLGLVTPGGDDAPPRLEPSVSPNGGRFNCSRMGMKGGCTVWRRCQFAPSTTIV